MSAVIGCNAHRLEDVDLMVFDKDGTLIDVHTYWAGMIGLRVEILADDLVLTVGQKKGLMESMGVDTDSMLIKPEGPVGLKKREIVLQAGSTYLAGEGFTRIDGLMETVFNQADKISLDRFGTLIRPLAGMRSLLECLRAVGCKIAIATTDRSDRTRLAFEHLGVLDLIDFIAGADMVPRPKPSGDILELVCGRLNVSLENTIMVGDASADVLAGQNAGCRASVGVASGLTTRDELEILTPYVVSSIKSLVVEHMH